MNKIFTILFLLVSFLGKAQLSQISLTEEQVKALMSINNVGENRDSINKINISFKQKNELFAKINEEDFLRIVELLHPKNEQAYLNNDKTYKTSGKIAADLVAFKPNNANAITDAIRTYKEKCVVANLTKYIQNQFFNFYFDNGMLNILDNDEYISLIKPIQALDLLNYSKATPILAEDIDFIARNSKFCF